MSLTNLSMIINALETLWFCLFVPLTGYYKNHQMMTPLEEFSVRSTLQVYTPPAVPPATPPSRAPVRRATSGAAGPIIPLPASVVIAKEGQVAKVDAPPGKQLVRCSPTWQGERSPAAATPPKAPATVPRPAPTCRQQGWKWLQFFKKISST